MPARQLRFARPTLARSLRRRATVAALAAGAWAGVAAGGVVEAGAQVVYAPVRFQHDRQNPFYYAGDDGRVFRRAASPVGGAGRFGRVGGFDFASTRAGRTDVFRSVVPSRPRLYTDAIPGYDAFPFGLTVDDVRNEANARVARYYTKADLLAAAIPVGPTSAVVPPTASLPPRLGPTPIFDRVLIDPRLKGGDRATVDPAPPASGLGGTRGVISIAPARRAARPPVTPLPARPLLVLPKPDAAPAPEVRPRVAYGMR